ncbi:hypothetical protein C5748_00200 [Phyllobacterium phragmitis]|uniref:Uncharacterized protein n=1 Tax=Phyllobacterium phragmitis TaxID=2670329 RepID=A0A2S9IYN0_9HYPH|nr:hypothetical protein [Phyllobacterium phragmitis]PRD45636.1 hypothetical protein C5748_00200 [Phyllobacterium phragmitis]
MLGLLDLPSPALSLIDGLLTRFLPPIGRIVLWAAIGAIVSMELYRLLSPQAQISRIKQDLLRVQQQLNDFDGPFEEAWKYIRRMLSLASRRVLIVFPATLIASLPVLILIIWTDAHYGKSFPPPGQAIAVQIGGDYRGRWVDTGNGAAPKAEVMDAAGRQIAEVAVPKPIRTVHKLRWWNILIGNPAGYLPDDAPFDWVDFALPQQQFFSSGPEWLRGWEPIFFASLLFFAMTLKIVRQID